MAGAGETGERIAGADLSREGSPAARMEGKWEKDTAGTGRDTRVLCPNAVPLPAFPPGWAGGMGEVSASLGQTRAPEVSIRECSKHTHQGSFEAQLGTTEQPPPTRDALRHPCPCVPGAGSQEITLIW